MHYSQPRKISLLQIPQYKKFLKCYYNYRIIFTGLGHKDSCISVCHICLLAYTILHLPVQPSVHLSIHLDAGTVDHRFCEANRGELSRNFSTFKEKSGSLTSITTAHHHPLYSAVLMYSTQHHHINLRPILLRSHLGLRLPRGTFHSGFEKLQVAGLSDFQVHVSIFVV